MVWYTRDDRLCEALVRKILSSFDDAFSFAFVHGPRIRANAHTLESIWLHIEIQ